jgi:hypothetical protein
MELKEVVAAIEAKQAEFSAALEAKASNDVLDTLKAEIKDVALKGLEDVKEMNLKQGEEIEMLKKAQEAAPSMDKKSFAEVLKDAYAEGLEKFKAQGSKGMVEVEINTKAIDDGNITGDIPQAMREAGINKTPKERITARALMFNGTTDSPVVDWIEKVGETGVPLTLAECDAFPEEETDYAVFNTAVKKIGGMTKVSEEKLEDITWMSNEIRAELVERHEIVVENQLLNGDGLGNNLAGLIPTYATAFAAPATFANAIPEANRTDALRVAIVQISKALYNVSDIMLNPCDVASMELEKGGDGHYIMPPFRSSDGLTIKGIRVVETTRIPEGDFLVGDFSKAGVFVRRSPRLEIGLDGNDFSTDKRTVKLSERLAFRVKGRDTGAFVTGDFASAIAAILKPAI